MQKLSWKNRKRIFQIENYATVSKAKKTKKKVYLHSMILLTSYSDSETSLISYIQLPGSQDKDDLDSKINAQESIWNEDLNDMLGEKNRLKIGKNNLTKVSFKILWT